MPRHAAFHHAHQDHRAAVRVEPRIENKRAQRRLEAPFGRRDAFDHRFEDFFNAQAALRADQQRVGRGDRQNIFDLVLHFFGLRRRQINFVDHRDEGQVVVGREEGVRDGLRLDALARVHHQQRAFAGRKRARDFIGKIHVPRRINQI